MAPGLLMTCGGLLRIGAVPSPHESSLLSQAGYVHWVNVYGVDLAELYPNTVLARFDIAQFLFMDVFSVASPVATSTVLEDVPPDAYVARTTPEGREQFRAAVATVAEHLRNLEPTYVFCQQGRGRSPAVAMAALHEAWRLPLLEARAIVEALRPQAQLTEISVAAANWNRLHALTVVAES